MSTLRNYCVYVLRANNDFDPLVIPAKNAKTLKTFTHRGHKYLFDRESSYIVHEQWSMKYWLMPDRFQKYDRLMLFREPEDALHGVELPISPLRVPTSPETYEESPDLLKGVTRSQVLARYRAKQHFGKFHLPPWWVMVILGVLVVVALLIVTGAIPLGEMLTGHQRGA